MRTKCCQSASIKWQPDVIDSNRLCNMKNQPIQMPLVLWLASTFLKDLKQFQICVLYFRFGLLMKKKTSSKRFSHFFHLMNLFNWGYLMIQNFFCTLFFMWFWRMCDQKNFYIWFTNCKIDRIRFFCESILIHFFDINIQPNRGGFVQNE